MSRKSADEVENALSAHRTDIFREIGSLSPEKGVADAFV
jgi:hypothetical protein